MPVHIMQTPNGWSVFAPGTERVAQRCETYAQAVALVPARVSALTAAASVPGLLDEGWEDVAGIAFSEPTGDGRDFSSVAWSWRDPTESLMPLMWQTETEIKHFGAELAGFIETIGLDGTTPRATGRFYDTPVGVMARDALLDGRFFGVSVDPGAVEAELECTETDDDGFCVDAILQFLAYEIIGLTGTPFPAFARAAIHLASDAVEEIPADEPQDTAPAPEAVAAAAVARVAPVAPPAEWFADPVLDGPTPMHVADDGRVFGHLAAWGTCHIGRDDTCVTPPTSVAQYGYYCTGETRCADGTRVPSGVFTMGLGHAALSMSASSAVAHYDDTRYGVADLACGEDVHGIWVAGAIRPDLTDGQLRTLRAASPSGDWREIRGHLELVASLAVNVPGFPIPRDRARTASGRCVALIASGPRAGTGRPNGSDPEIAALRAQLGRLDAALAPLLRIAAEEHLALLRGD